MMTTPSQTAEPRSFVHAARSIAPWLAASAAVGALYIAVALAVNGRLALPLDDAYIFLQYARQAAHGHLLRYTAGEGASSGVTSPLYLSVLAVLYLIGLRGPVFPYVPLVIGVAGLAVSAATAQRIAGRIWGKHAGILAGLLIVAHGPLAWHFLSGMETPVLVPLLLLAVESFLLRRTGRFAWTAGLLATARPEGWMVALLLAGWAMSAWRGERRRALLFVPPAAGLLPLAMNLAASGRLQSNSFITKAPAEWGLFYLPEYAHQCLRFFLEAVRGLYFNLAPNIPTTWAANDGSAASLYFAPGAAILAVAALASAPGAAVPILAALGMLLALVTSALPVPMHWERYLTPTFPLLLILVAGGATVVREKWGAAAGRAVLVVLIGFQAVSLAAFALTYAACVHDLAFMHVTLGRWMDAQLPKNALIAANDVGAITYYGHRPILDLEGLTSDAMTRPARNGAASLYEAIEAMPAANRPTHLCVFPSWYDDAFTAIHQPIYVLRLFQVTIAASNPMVLYRADWSLAGSGDVPRSAEALGAIAGLTVSDRLDVADLASEKAHDYRIRAADGGYEPRLKKLATAGGEATVIDGGRLVTGSETFRLSARTGRDAVLVLRTDGVIRARVSVDGRAVGMVQSSRRAGDEWYEEITRIPGTSFTRAGAKIEVATENAHYLGYGSYHYWLYQ